MVEENSLTPTLARPSSIRPTFEMEFDFDSLVSPSLPDKSNPNTSHWKDAFLTDLHVAKKTLSTAITSPSVIQIESETKEDTLWEFMKESNPKLLEKLERTTTTTTNDKQKRIDRFSTQQPTSTNTKPAISVENIPTSIDPILNEKKQVETSFPPPPPAKSMSVSEVTLKQPEPSNISIIEIRLENGIDNIRRISSWNNLFPRCFQRSPRRITSFSLTLPSTIM